MTHRFPIKEIARQAGLGTATVDRVLNQRPHVGPQTRNRVHAAIAELEQQEAQLSARGRRMFIDIVIEAPSRFSNEVKRATEAILPSVAGAVFRPRFHLQQTMTDRDVIAVLDRIAKRGSHGVCLKARNEPAIQRKVDQLVSGGVPVCTLVTDLPSTKRCGYVGLSNRRAGQTAAYLLAQHGLTAGKAVLTSRSREAFFGEQERFDAFTELYGALCPSNPIIEVNDGAGLPVSTAEKLAAVLPEVSSVGAVYSMGGGNAAILAALADHGAATAPFFIAHDLDQENVRLLQDRRIHFILHHDLRSDMRRLFQAVLAEYGLAPRGVSDPEGEIQVIGPYNIPSL